jgi:hypothetical protein
MAAAGRCRAPASCVILAHTETLVRSGHVAFHDCIVCRDRSQRNRGGCRPRRHPSRLAPTAVILPPGLPRPHYNFRTTISYDAPYPYRRAYAHPAYVYETEEVRFTRVYAEVPYLPPLIGVPLPGYDGSAYRFGGPYYGGPYVPYWDRLPYACGVYGYC